MNQILVCGQPASVNHYKRIGRNGRPYTTRNCRIWMRRIRDGCLGQTPMHGRLCVVLQFYWGDNRKRDIDNFIKPVLDACNQRLWDDDSQIDDLHVQRCKSSDKTAGVVINWGEA